MSPRTISNGAPMTLSQVPGSPSFRSSAVNAVAVIPLLSSDRNGQDDPTTHSSQSFVDLLDALGRYNNHKTTTPTTTATPTTTTTTTPTTPPNHIKNSDDLLLVVPNSQLTRPGDWRYDNTPLKNFHWGHGCQRLAVFDGRPYNSRMAHDRLMNHGLTRDWIDLCPQRRTAAVIGVLNMRDCPDMATLKRAEQEWQQWAERYSTPPYEVTAHGRDFERDFVVQRLFVFDSFHESNKIDMNETTLGSKLVAFPPSDHEHTNMMDMHLNVVINDLAVAVFEQLEGRIRESDAITRGTDGQPLTTTAARSRFFQKASIDGDGPQASSNLSINALASVVSPDSKLADATPTNNKRGHPLQQHQQQQQQRPSIQSKLQNVTQKGTSSEAQLLTPLDDVWDYSELSPKDAQEMMRREVGRREKFAADMSLLAGSPLDAYERYTKAAELCKTLTPDPLWYASALEGCAAAHIAMAEVGGFNVDEYMENSFQLPDEFMACAVVSANDKTTKNPKQILPRVVAALCDEALNITSRHPRLACFRAELLVKLAWYTAEVEDTHIRCKWGMGDGCYGGDPSDSRRWEKASATQLNFLELKNRDGEDIIALDTLQRLQKWTDFMHRAVSTGDLDPVTRADVALRCASMCLQGLRPTEKPTARNRSDSRIHLHRKAAFFVATAAEAMSEIDGDMPDNRASALWLHASKLFSPKGNPSDGVKYGWATLRASALHALAIQGIRESSEEAAVQLLALIGEISPEKQGKEGLLAKLDSSESEEGGIGNFLDNSKRPDANDDSNSFIGAESYIGDISVVSAARNARSFVRDKAQTARGALGARNTNFFSGQTSTSTLLIVAQSKWADDDPIAPLILPLGGGSEISHGILAMRAVWSDVKYNSCVGAQKRLIQQISELRKDLPASSMLEAAASEKGPVASPLRIASAGILKTDAHTDIERVKVKKKEANAENQGAMATFYNPYAKKGAVEATLIPEGEERYILVEFVNNLSVQLEIPRCQLEFKISESDRIKAPAISFVIPGQTSNFAVQFPFIVMAATNPQTVEESSAEEGEKQNPGVFEIKGLHVTCLGRSFFLPLDESSGKSSKKNSSLPRPASHYPGRKYTEAKKESGGGVKSPPLEIVPPQPNLLFSFAASPTPIDETTTIPALLSDGEVFAIPSIHLENDAGSNRLGKVEHLRITAHGLPGLSELVLFDSDGNTASTEPSKSKKTGGVIPLKLTALCEGLDRDKLNAKGNRKGESAVSIQLAATHDMGTHTKGCTIQIRFRYKGASASPDFQLWKKREVTIRVIRIKGPRISSLTFRPDLNWESAYSELCKSLALQNKTKRIIRNSFVADLPQAGSTDDEEFVVNRVGMDEGVHVCSDKVVILLSVSNETNTPIILSNPSGGVGGFENSPIDTLRVPPGVSAKIPILIPRVDRSTDIVTQMLEMATLNWKSEISSLSNQGGGDKLETGGAMLPVNRRVRGGALKIPSGCLKAIVDENPTFLSRVCKAPCKIEVAISGQGGSKVVEVAPGKPLDTTMKMDVTDWVRETVLDKSQLTLEFCCARKEKDTFRDTDDRRDYVWCGQIRKSLAEGTQERSHKHNARLIFLREGHYVVSACANIINGDGDDDAKEVWWAQTALHVHVIKESALSQ